MMLSNSYESPVEVIEEPIEAIPVGEDRWKTRWIWVGLFAFALLHVTSWIDHRWLEMVPSWLLFLLGMFLPQLFFLSFPLVTRERQSRTPLKIPPLTTWLTELAIAVPTVFATLFLLGGLNWLIGRLWPGKTITPEAFKSLGEAPLQPLVYLFLVFMFTVPPICEEVFFRWFLFRAFRARMPLVVACLTTSLVFGFGHTFGAVHGAIASVLGIVLALLYQWRKTLITPTLVHAGINFFGALGLLATMVMNANSPMLGIIQEPNETACVVHDVLPGSAAADAKLQPGDVITNLDDIATPDLPHLLEAVRKHKAGDKVVVTIKRNGISTAVDVVLKRRGG